MRVYLAGFMGSGKSTVGPPAAEVLGLDFLDLDDQIEQRAERSIPAIFEAGGEAAFRQIEREALHCTAEHDQVMVALGGGTVVAEANRTFAQSNGLLIYLEVSVDTILERVADGAAHRPLLQDEHGTPLSMDRMRARIERMLEARRAAYEAAPVTVDANRSVEAVVLDVTTAVQAWQS